MDNDDLKRQGVQAKLELHETEASFKAIREGIIERMLSAKTDDEARSLVWRLQAVDAVQSDLIGKAANLEIVAHEEEVAGQ